MSAAISPNTQAILLLAAPLIAGRREPSSDLLTPREYKQLARMLREIGRQPADLLGPAADETLKKCQPLLDCARLERLLARGFLLSQAVERWQARAIWVISRADGDYPKRLKERLREDSPPVLYGCGEPTLLATGGLAVVGSRHVDDELVVYTEGIGRLAAAAGRTLISGGARGIDQAAMRGALDVGGSVAGVLADSLERAALARDHRDVLMNGRLVLISPYDPAAGFHVGHAMQRNKLIYALADAALVVSSDFQKGGTWTGAIEQLDELRFVPVYVRSNGESEKGLDALRQKGARPWPNPLTPEALMDTLAGPAMVHEGAPRQEGFPFGVEGRSGECKAEDRSECPSPEAPAPGETSAGGSTPAGELFAKVRELLRPMDTPKTDAEVSEELGVSRSQAKEWLQRLVEEGVLERLSRPVRYRSASSLGSLFDRRD